MKKVLITGGAGFIGSHVVERHLAEGNRVVVVDDLSMGQLSNIPDNENLVFYKETITNYNFMADLLVKENFDYIYLLAAIASVADTIERPYTTHQVNQEANLFILETLRTQSLKPKRVLFSSSAATYGTLPDLPKKESGAVEPATAYAIDKYATERFVLSYAQLYDIPGVAVRFFNVYGPRQNPASPYSGVLSIASSRLKNDETFTMFGDGTQTRDFVYVKDVIQALKIAETNDSMVGEVFNVATGTSIKLIDALQLMEQAAGKTLDIQFGEERTGDIKYSAANIDKLSAQGYKAQYSFEDGIKEYWESL